MITIPENKSTKHQEDVDKVCQLVLDQLNTNETAMVYWSSIPSLQVAREVANIFVSKGYYAKITHFTESWKGFQKLAVSIKPLKEFNSCKVYDEFIR